VKDLRIAILAGGSGTRFWPAGRRSRPKQVLPLDGDDPSSLIALTVERLAGLSPAPWIVAPKALRRELARHVPHLADDAFVLEPRPRNTAAAVVLAAHVAARSAEASVVVAVPADHHVRPAGRYRRVLAAMASRAKRSRRILTLGLRPEGEATGYGYLRLGDELETRAVGGIYEVEDYIEKPAPDIARRLSSDGRHLWNGGTFAFRPDVLLEEAAAHLPEVAAPLTAAFAKWGRRGFATALAKAYDAIPSISVDYGIMERTKRVETLASDLEWDDLGSWDAVARHRTADEKGNQVRGDVTLVDAANCVVDAAEGHVALLDVDDLVVVRTKDTVLVTRRGRGERIRDVVARLEKEGREDLLK
jgi:mannose-1-phosphate guanylyltransferase